MKNNFFQRIVFASALALVFPGLSFAADLGLNTGLPTLEASSALIEYLEFGPDGDLASFAAEVDSVEGVSPVGFSELGFLISFDLADPTVGAFGGLDIFDDDGLFLAGDLIAVGFTENIIQLQFGDLMGAGAAGFGSSVLAIIAFEDALGSNPFDSLVDDQSYGASITVLDVASVPIPAALPLFLSAILGLGWIGRKRNTA